MSVWYDSVISVITDLTLAPPTEVSGDRYLLSGTGTVHVDWDGAVNTNIVEFNGSIWVATTPSLNDFVPTDDEFDIVYRFDGTEWCSVLLGGSCEITKFQVLQAPKTCRRLAYVPCPGEPVWDEEECKLYVGDGITPGGKCVGGGAATNLIVQKDDVDVTINTATINFEGNAVTSVVDEGSGKSTIAIDETLTTIQIIAPNTLRYTDENGAQTDIDLSVYLDDTNLARLVSGTLNPVTGILTVTRDDTTTFDIDLSGLLDTDTTLQIQKDDANVGGVTETLNFEGPVVQSVTDEGSNKTTVILDDTLTTLQLVGDDLKYTDEDGVITTLDLGTVTGEAGDCPAVQICRTTDFTVPTSWTDVPMDSTDIENDPAVLEHNNVNTERIDIKVTGLYDISYNVTIDVEKNGHNWFRVYKNGTTELPCSKQSLWEVSSQESDYWPVSSTLKAELTAGDYVTFQVKGPGGTTHLENGRISFNVTKCSGAKGDTGPQGPAGAGTDLVVQKDDVTVGTITETLNFEGSAVSTVVDEGTNKTTVTIADTGADLIVQKDDVTVGTTTDTLNFEGAGVSTVVDEGTNKTTVTIPGGGVGTELSTVQARRTTNVSLTTTYTDINLDTTDVENDATVIEHDNVNTDRIKIKETSLYLVQYNAVIETASGGYPSLRVRVNDTTVLAGSEIVTEDGNDSNHSGAAFVVNLTANDYISLQAKATAGTHTLTGDTTLNVIKLTGVKGDTGATGAGSNIVVQKDDATVGTVTDTLNFEGAGVSTVIDEGANKTTVTITGGGGGGNSKLFDGYCTDVSALTTSWSDVPVNVERKNSGDFTHTANSAEVTVDVTGTYLVMGKVVVNSNSSSTVRAESRLMLDTGGGYAEVAATFSSVAGEDSSQPEMTFMAILDLTAADKLKMQAQEGTGSFNLREGSSLIITTVGTNGANGTNGTNGADGAAGPQGPAGPTGSGSNIICQDEGTNVANTPHDKLNFTGAGVTVSDGGAGVATINITSGSGDVTAAANLADNAIIRGDGAAKGVQKSDWTIDDNGVLATTKSYAGFLLNLHNLLDTGGGDGVLIKAGEVLGDINLRLCDEDGTFNILDVEADRGYFTYGKTYDQTLADNGIVYGQDNQRSAGQAADFNTQNGVYRIAGKASVMMTEYQDASSDVNSSTTATTFQQKLRMTTPSLPLGKYRIGWTGEMKNDGSGGKAQIQINDTTTIGTPECADSSSVNYFSIAGFHYESGLSGVVNIDLDYCSQSSGTTNIRNVRLEIWRVE